MERLSVSDQHPSYIEPPVDSEFDTSSGSSGTAVEKELVVTSLIPAHLPLTTESKYWAPIVEEDLPNYLTKLGSKALFNLRSLFLDNEEAYRKIFRMELAEMKEAMGMAKDCDETFLRILSALVSVKSIRDLLGLSQAWAYAIHDTCCCEIADDYEGIKYQGGVEDMDQFWKHCNNGYKPHS